MASMLVIGRGARTNSSASVPSLVKICTRVLVLHLDALEYVGDVPDRLMQPILSKCSVSQLARLEDMNPGHRWQTDELWKGFIRRDFPSKTDMDPSGLSWYEYWQVLEVEKAERRANLGHNVAQMYKQCDEEKKNRSIRTVSLPEAHRARRRGRGGSSTATAGVATMSAIQRLRHQAQSRIRRINVNHMTSKVASRPPALGVGASGSRSGGSSRGEAVIRSRGSSSSSSSSSSGSSRRQTSSGRTLSGTAVLQHFSTSREEFDARLSKRKIPQNAVTAPRQRSAPATAAPATASTTKSSQQKLSAKQRQAHQRAVRVLQAADVFGGGAAKQASGKVAASSERFAAGRKRSRSDPAESSAEAAALRALKIPKHSV